jgi:DNA-binding NarL/FixJ family response regulator
LINFEIKEKMAKRLLVVDDEPNLLAAIAAVLRGEGFEITTARNGKDALLQIAKSLPDLIVSDVRMPVMDGFTLARQLRSAPHTKLIPIVFLTAKDETEDRIEGFRAGVDVYLTKPFEPDELVAVIRSVLARVERTRTALTTLIGKEEPKEEILVRDEELTEAEWRVAREVANGLSNKEIAVKLDLSVRTVESHISRILAKKNFSNRVEIARQILSKQSND